MKSLNNTIIDCTVDPYYIWLLVLMYICLLMNYTCAGGINDVPIINVTVSTVDISCSCVLDFSNQYITKFVSPVSHQIELKKW